MSQSDYIQYKKTQQVLSNQNKNLSKIIEQNDYTNFQQYTIETTVPNTKLRYSRLIPPSTISVLNMDQKTANCPTFLLCKNTQTRPNRVLNTGSIITYKNKPMPITSISPLFNKIKDPTYCTFHPTLYTTRVCPCTKTICKCGTKICENMHTEKPISNVVIKDTNMFRSVVGYNNP
jgi:hypothetical protein